MKKVHLMAIDGLKGLAILAVVCTHIPLKVWYAFIPPILQKLLNPLLSGGGVGVNIFFIITGFLMGLLYPAPASAISFYSRRYARLLPAFLTMVIGFTIFNLIKIPPYAQILTIIILALIMRFFARVWQNKLVIRAFLVLQLIIGLIYVFYLQKIPASIYYINWSTSLRTGITALINAALILPLGNYVDQFDGIYWALCAEVAFYLLYPIIIAPILQYITEKTSLRGKLLLFIAFIPFCYGLFMVSQRILNLAMIQLQLFIYFIAGAYIGMKKEQIKKKLLRFQSLFSHPVWIIFLLLIVFNSVALDGFLTKYYQRWVSILMVLPIGLLLVTAVSIPDEKKTLLKNPVLIFLGKYSYAIFLTHSLVIHLAQNYIPTTSAINGLSCAGLSLLGTVGLAWVLHTLTERPYFLSRIKSSVGAARTATSNAGAYLSGTPRKKVVVLSLVILFFCYFAYRPPVSLFTFVFRHGTPPIKTVTLTDKPFRFSFTAKENNLGMILTSLRRDKIPNREGGFVPFELYLRLLDSQEKVVSQSKFLAYQIIENRYHPFGFPLQTDSNGKNYAVEYQLSKKGYSEEIKIITDEANLLSVYFVEKKALLQNPFLLINWLVYKIGEPLANPMFPFTLFHLAPFLILLLVVVFKKPFLC